jgi:hypothetical protein
MTITDRNKLRTRRYEAITYLSINQHIAYDAARLLIGDVVGEGQYRNVFTFDLLPNTVIKVSDVEGNANLIEWNVWRNVKGEKFEKWFAPCIYCSPGGHFLIQKRVKPLPVNFKFPKRMPSFFSDFKPENFGLFKNNLVCHDYQFIGPSIDAAFKTKKLCNWRLNKPE